MPAKTGIRNGLAYGWSLGENNWNTGMDGNLTFIDRFGIHLSFKSFLDTPPGSPTAGDCYVVDSAPTGAWVGKVGQVAVYDDGAWRYGVPRTGWQAYCEADEGRYVFDGAWNLLAVGDISGLTAALAGKADLVGGVVPSNQLPSYVDDVIEVADFASLPATGETGKIYVTLADNNSWRWTGSTYQKVSQPLDEMPQDVAEAGTSETLYASTSRRIRQAIAAWWLTASSAFGRTLANVADAAAGRTALGLGNVDNTSDASKPVSTAQQTALDGKEPAIAAGTSAQFWRGNKTWADFATTVRDAALTGLSTASAAVVTAADSVLVAIGKLQAQISDVVTQTDAEAGTATAVKAWTAQRVRQASNAAIYDASSVTPTSSKIPVAGLDGKIDPAWIRQSANDIGTAGSQGFGVGICPAPPAGMSRMAGTLDVASANYGNYQYSDGSIMIWIPAYFYKWGTGANGLAINDVSIKPRHAFATVADANAAGYALHRAFYDGGVEKSGFFVDKYLWSNNGGIASSIAGANPISSAADHNPFSGLSGAPVNAYYGAIAVAKTRGADFFVCSRFIYCALALLAYAHGRASQSATYCAWYHATDNFPKGCNNNALRDTNDTEVLYTSTGHATYPNCGKTGSGVPFAKTTHNGQVCGVADLNGNLWEIAPGITSDGANFYVLKASAAMKSVTAGTALATDLWGATGIAAMYDSLGATYESLAASSTSKLFGAAAQVLSAETSGNAWAAAGAGIPLAGGLGGTNAFGDDVLADYRPNLLCPLSGGYWGYGASAGVWALHLSAPRTYSNRYVGGRSALYL